MRGIPKVFNTEQDIVNSMAVDVAATRARLQELLDGRFCWMDVGAVADGASGQTDATHKVLTMRSGGMGPGGQEGPEERRQYELREDPNAWLFRIGLTVEKAESYLAQAAPGEEQNHG